MRTASTSAVLAAVPDASLPRKVVAADFNVPLDEGTVADLIDVACPGGRAADGDTMTALAPHSTR